MEFLPYHFLLATSSAKGYLSWLDVSIGKQISGFQTGLGRLNVMCQNPSNAILHCGHPGGTVTLWSPNVKEPLVKMLCHGSGTRAIAVRNDGLQMATSGADNTVKIWDLRTNKLLQGLKIRQGAGRLAYSQRNMLAVTSCNDLMIFKEGEGSEKAVCEQIYLEEDLQHSVHDLQFCPYEDVLGISHINGFQSFLIPGAGEPNFDALEANPYQSKSQRKEAEVKMLLEKIQPELISLDSHDLGRVDTETLKETLEAKAKLKYLKPRKIDFEPKYKTKGRSKGKKAVQRKKGVQEERKLQEIKDHMKAKKTKKDSDEDSDKDSELTSKKEDEKYNVFKRFSKSK